MSSRLSIEFQLLVIEDHLSVDDLLKNPIRLLDYYTKEESSTDSAFQGGYCITVDDKKWNAGSDGEFYFDMFSYSLNWLSGIEKLLRKEVIVANVAFWEESIATATLVNKDEIELIDKHVSGKVIAAPVIVELNKFCLSLLKETRKYMQLAKLVEREIASINPEKRKQIISLMCAEDFLKSYSAIEKLIENRI